MTILGWIIWGIIAFIVILAFALRRFYGERPDMNESQIRAEQQAKEFQNINTFTDGH